MTNLKVLICGAGIAGNSLAFWLSELGHDVTVIEYFSKLRSTGLQIDLRGHGIEVMRRMGLEEKFRARSVTEQGFEIVDKSGKRRAYFPANRTSKGLQSFTTDFEIMRGDFVKLLHEVTKDRVKYLFGTFVESFEQYGDSVDVLFSDGKRDRFDLLVGADGQGSHTRRMMLGPSTIDPIHFIDLYICYFTMPRPIAKGEQYIATSFFAPGSRGVMTRRHNADRVQVYMSCNSQSSQLKHVRKGDVKKEKEAFVESFRGAGWRTEEFTKALEQADDFYCERPGVVKLDCWSSDRVVLVGDAAYSPTVNTGMGTTSSVVGAYILAGEISEHCGRLGTKSNLHKALQEYDRKFRPFMDQVQRGVAEDEGGWNKFMPTTATGIAIFNFLMGMASFLKIDILSKMVLHEDVKDWSLPNYTFATD